MLELNSFICCYQTYNKLYTDTIQSYSFKYSYLIQIIFKYVYLTHRWAWFGFVYLFKLVYKGWAEGSLFDSCHTKVLGEGATPFSGLLHFTLKQGSIKYHFLCLWYDSNWDWNQVIGPLANTLTIIPMSGHQPFYSVSWICH